MHLHFIGIGGIGMSGIARIFLQLGYKISGSDTKKTETTTQLRQQGALIYKGHRENQVKGADMVIFSSAIKSSNPEIKQAKKEGILLLSRGELIAQITNPKESIVIAGTHGKTTTTGLIAELLLRSGRDPTIFMGGILKKINSNSRWGNNRWAVVESDESDASFLYLRPSIAVLTNVEDDHLDFYGSRRNIFNAFVKFTYKIKPGGVGIVNIDDPASFHILRKVGNRKKFLTYGLSPEADISAKDINLKVLSSSFKVKYKKNIMGEVKVPLSGIHNIYNCLAAVGAGYLLGVKWATIKYTLLSFQGVKRRIEKVGQVGCVPVFDDYAHHPTEIRAVLGELKKIGRRVIAVFQPHRYTRVKFLLPQFLTAFEKADVLILTPIYSAGEKPIPGINGKVLFKALQKKRASPTYYIPSKERIIKFIRKNLEENDLIITLGAGDITKLSTQIILHSQK